MALETLKGFVKVFDGTTEVAHQDFRASAALAAR